ncbi:protein-ADP-ribose hydrolase [Roseibium sp. SCP14]|uniref:protein-ADP-ribose hydrolase n=1 Tax=Roseibium sp. SCP14 TaxID=3141375 RepID=UPI0033397C79
MQLNDYANRIHLFEEPAQPGAHSGNALEHAVSAVQSDLGLAKFVQRYPAPSNSAEQRQWVQAALTVRPPGGLPAALTAAMEELLQSELSAKQIIDAKSLPRLSGPYPPAGKVSIWDGDITTLKVDAITNAANAQMLGCFQPFHACIDNAINCAAGPQLREDCEMLMRLQGHEEETGNAKITRAYNLPSLFVLHTVGPIVGRGKMPTAEQEHQLASCYTSCLSLAAEAGARSVALCGISTGVFGYPAPAAAQIALRTVAKWVGVNEDALDHIVFNTFGADMTAIYLDTAQNWRKNDHN